VKQKFCASSWLITEINILRCTVSKTSNNKYCYNTSVQNPLLEVLNRAKGLNEENPHPVPCEVFVLLSYVNVKQSHYRPGQDLRVPGGLGSQISRQSAHDCGKVVSPTQRPPLPQEIFLALISVRG